MNNRSLFSLTFDSEREEGGREGRDSGIIGHYRLTEITRFQVNVNVLPFIIAFISNQSSNGTKCWNNIYFVSVLQFLLWQERVTWLNVLFSGTNNVALFGFMSRHVTTKLHYKLKLLSLERPFVSLERPFTPFSQIDISIGIPLR